jgi:hypothetical protein
MALDFWNNPIVVSAFRVRHRKGSLFRNTALYVLLLACIGAAMEYWKDRIPDPHGWVHAYFLTLITIQFLVSGLMAGSATAVSMRNEVINRTLDFQRIAALSPRQILVGKLFGEPAHAYLSAIASVPLAFFCWLLGGVSLDILLVLYLNLATTTLLFGVLGLNNRLEPPMAQSEVTLIGLAGILSPTLLINAFRHDNPWHNTVFLFGYQIPWLLLLPPLQLAMAYLCFQTMERRLLNPLLPQFSKKMAYALLIVSDVVIAAALIVPPPLVRNWPLSARWGLFCICHLLACLWLMTTVTPFKDTLHDWVWRYRGRRSRLWDLWLGDRSANGLVLLTFCVVGVVGLFLGVLLPDGLDDHFAQVSQQAGQITVAVLLTCLMLLALGTVHQRAVLLAGRNGVAAFFLVFIILDMPVHTIGQYYGLNKVLAFSASAHFNCWIQEQPPLNPLPVLGVYGLLFAVTALSVYGRIHRLERIVDGKLRLMGVGEPVPAGGV